MKFKVERFCRLKEPNSSILVEYEIPLKNPTALEAVTYIKKKVDATLTFSSGCKSEVCGSCAVRVNGKEQLLCGYKLVDGDLLEPLRYMDLLKDLVVDYSKSAKTIKRAVGWQSKISQKEDISYEDQLKIERQSDCILCASCYSSCPVFEVDSDFLGPFALTKNYRYISDIRCEDEKEKIDAVQNRGIWDCTLCGECTMVCPQGIDPKNDILMLRAKSIKYGYMDPNFSENSSSFGFNPDF